MARIRTIKPEFWQDEKLGPLDPLTRLVFLGLICMADDAGRIVDSIKAIDGFLFALTNDSAHEALMRLSGTGRILRGVTASGQRVIQIANWGKHQRVQHPQLAAALPEIVDVIADTVIHEPLMNDSGAPHEALAPHSNDLRPTTNEQRAVRANAWVDPFAVEWEARIGMAPKPALARDLWPLVERHGVPQVFAAWQGYVREGKGTKWVGIAHFVRTYKAVADRLALSTDDAGEMRPIPDRPGHLSLEAVA